MKRKIQTGPELNTPDVLGTIVTASVAAVLAVSPIFARDLLAPMPKGKIFHEKVAYTEDPTPFTVDGPEGIDPLGIKGVITNAQLDAACSTNACYSRCEQGLVNPFCFVYSASCSSESECQCTYFCARDGNGRQWTPKQELAVTE